MADQLPNLLNFLPRTPKAQRSAYNEYTLELLNVSHRKICRLLEEHIGAFGAEDAVTNGVLHELLASGPRADLRIWEEGLRNHAIDTVNGFIHDGNRVMVIEQAHQPVYYVEVLANSSDEDVDFMV